ncbi:MAG TPA: sigma-70 family RNA polymerase sigma factor [Polyangiaceae bacterium]|nr:sigma-70 family RNA polymerase sigma factor [Polyangiaceae bacterium]
MIAVGNPPSRAWLQPAPRSPIAVLNAEDEASLLERWKSARDARAAARLILAHRGLVVLIAQRYRHFGVAFDDLVAEGSLGMFKALDRFDPAHGVRLSTYARYWIKSCIVEYVLKNWSVVTSGLAFHSRMFFKIRRERSRALALDGDGPLADQRLAERLGISVDNARALAARVEARDLSLDAPLGTDSETSLLDRLASPLESRGEIAPAPRNALHAAIAKLDQRERYIIERRWLSEDESVTLASIARTLGVSRERARQLELRAKSKLKRSLVVAGHDCI